MPRSRQLGDDMPRSGNPGDDMPRSRQLGDDMPRSGNRGIGQRCLHLLDISFLDVDTCAYIYRKRVSG